MKGLLLSQALSPIAFLMLFKTFPFERIYGEGFTKAFQDCLLLKLLLIMLIIWILVAFLGRCYFASFSKFESDKKNISASNIEEDKISSLEFFMTFLLPLVIDDTDKINGFAVFWMSLITIALLLRKTTLFYQNPILAGLGYKMYWLDINGERKLGISTTTVKIPDLKINYTSLTDDVIFFKKV